MITLKAIPYVGERMCANRQNLFYASTSHERPQRRARREAEAKQVCESCVNTIVCRDYAREIREPYGVWGGETEYERFRAGFSSFNPFRRQQRPSYHRNKMLSVVSKDEGAGVVVNWENQ